MGICCPNGYPPTCNSKPPMRPPHWNLVWCDRHRFYVQVEWDINIGTEEKPVPKPMIGTRILCTARRNELPLPNTVKEVVIVSTQSSPDPVGDIIASKAAISSILGVDINKIYQLGVDCTVDEWQPGYTEAVPRDMNPGSVTYHG